MKTLRTLYCDVKTLNQRYSQNVVRFVFHKEFNEIFLFNWSSKFLNIINNLLKSSFWIAYKIKTNYIYISISFIIDISIYKKSFTSTNYSWYQEFEYLMSILKSWFKVLISINWIVKWHPIHPICWYVRILNNELLYKVLE